MFETISAPRRPDWKMRIVVVAASVACGVGIFSLLRMTQMPLKSYRGPLPPLSVAQSELAGKLSEHVRYLSTAIGVRNLDRTRSLNLTADYIRGNMERSGYTVNEFPYTADGQVVSNLQAEQLGSENSRQTIVIGAHYDTVMSTAGADDNASGVAAVLELARLMKGRKFRRSLRFVFFVNEEPPYFQTTQMGSWVYAKTLHRDGIQVSAMISLETLGFYSDEPNSQRYPALLRLFYPRRGDFIGFVGNSESRDLIRRAIRSFRRSARFPSEGIAGPAAWPGIGWSDHWSFWQEGYPAIMITDTATFRYPYYHTAGDTHERLDFEKMARVVEGTDAVVSALADEQ